MEDATEVLSDVQAYLSAGELDGAADILIEGLEMLPYGAIDRLMDAIRVLTSAFYNAGKYDEGNAVTRRIVDAALKRNYQSVDPCYLDLYATACIETGTTPFPTLRIFRHHNLVNIFRSIPDAVAGDVVECGCAQGLSFLQLCLAHAERHPNWNGAGFHIFDSFEGLSEPTEHDRETTNAAIGKMMAAGRFAVPLDVVSKNVHRRFPGVKLHPGWIPETFATQPERVYRFVHIDVDLYQPTLDSLSYFYPRLAHGGIVITDDYNWPGAKKAFDEFCNARGLQLQTTETSQAFLTR